MTTGFTHEIADTNRPDRDEHYTPPDLLAALGDPVFDVDVCVPSMPEQLALVCVKATTRLTAAEDGILTPWGPRFAWCNAPYSVDLKGWAAVFSRHLGKEGLWLSFNSSETEAMQTIYAMGTPALLLNRRLRHIDGRRVVEDKASRLRASAAPVMKPNPNFGKPGDSPPKGSVLVASSYGRDYQALLRASRAGWGVIVQRSA